MSRRGLAPLFLLLAGVVLAGEPGRLEAQTPAEDLVLQEKAEPYMAFADQIVAALRAGQSGAFRASLSPTLLASTTKEELDAFVDRQVIPFFADYATPGEEQWVAPTTHPAGLTGFAFFRSFTASDGTEKPFVLYLLEEDGRLVVGNLLVGRSFQDMHPQQ
ncbi:MAG: hypothetical protein BroJett029_29970 [Alphaproteobacteria bacterium]|nr:MAG: hypothetical protein BroJett029_29970 [Alphaproteobacteria bacterium]